MTLPFKPARLVPETAIAPAYLVPAGPKVERTELRVDVGVIEITSAGDVLIRPDFTMSPNPYNGALVRFQFDPKEFFVVDDMVGVRSGEVVLDLSELVSPPEAERAGFGPTFRGVYLEELGLYFPRNTPIFVPKSVTLKNALIGDGFAGEGVIEMSDAPDPPPTPQFFQVDGASSTPMTIGADDIISIPRASTIDGEASWQYRIVAVADVSEAWRGRRSRARWTLPNGELFRGERTEVLSVRPGDTLEYFYDPPSTDGAFEAPGRRTFMFDVEGPIREAPQLGSSSGSLALSLKRRLFSTTSRISTRRCRGSKTCRFPPSTKLADRSTVLSTTVGSSMACRSAQKTMRALTAPRT